MKKTIILLFLAAFFSLTISCKSSKASENNKSESDEKISAPESKNEKTNSATTDGSKKEIILSRGIVQLKVKPNLGSFNIGAINKDGKVVPVLTTSNEYTSSNLQLKVGKKIYKPVSAAGVMRSAFKTGDGVCIIYEIPKVAKAEIFFDFTRSSADNDLDTLKIVCEITNIGTRKDEFALKMIYDTVLGETTQNHFYAGGNVPVKNEVMYRNMQNQKWVISKNDSAAAQFLFDGGDVTPPEIVALANNSTFSKKTWEPDMLSYRAFDTVLSYNNSCLGAIWNLEELAPGQSAKIIHYISLAVDSKEPCGENLVYGIQKKQSENGGGNSAKEIQKDVRGGEQTDSRQIAETKIETENKIANENNANGDKKNPNVEFNVNAVPKEKFTPQYIQSLLDRIDELEKDSASINREEILKLNDELDEILSALRQ